jgi:hypothetical protein
MYSLSVWSFSLLHKLYMVQFEVFKKARLVRGEVTQGDDATPTRTSGLKTRVSGVVGVRNVCKSLLL